MRITVIQKIPAFGLRSTFLGACAGVAGYWSYTHQDHNFIWAGVIAFIISLAAFFYSLRREQVIIRVDESGIFDRRLGVGLILWRDVTNVQLFLDEDHRYICIHLRNPDVYIQRLPGERRAKMLHSHDLGFKGFNVDVAAMDVNIIRLKELIDRFVEQRQRE